MKRFVLLITLFIVVWNLGGCGSPDRGTRASESAFLANFSLAPILEANEQYLIARHTISGSAVSEPPVAFFQKHEEGVVQVDATNIPALMAAVTSDIAQLLVSSGAQIHGHGRGGNDGEGPEGRLSNIDYFSFRYSQDNAEGAVNVWGVSGKETSFTLIVLITEGRGE
jgi:hypothetical protein